MGENTKKKADKKDDSIALSRSLVIKFLAASENTLTELLETRRDFRRSRRIGRAWAFACLVTWLALAANLLLWA